MYLSEIWIYPVKSLKGFQTAAARVEKRGLAHDRRRMLVDERGVFISQRENPKLALIQTRIDGDRLFFSARGGAELNIELEPAAGPIVDVRVWDSVCPALVADERVNRWFTDVLKKDCRLVYMPEETKREIGKLDTIPADIVSFADGYPLLLIGEGSLTELNNRSDEEIRMNRFRPNLVIGGTDGFAEDDWQRIEIGDTRFQVAGPCARCVVTTIDQEQGRRFSNEPLKTLADFRRAANVYPNRFEELGLQKNAVLFGQNLIPLDPQGLIKAGDPVKVLG